MSWEVHHGDCLAVMPTLPAESVDTIITDPPYGLSFMGKAWDHGVPGVPFWREALRVAKPGAFLLAFGGTRTHHRLMVAIEDAGWEIRDCMMWLYGSGFPKSHDISKAIDKAAGAEREVVGVNHPKYKRRNGTTFGGSDPLADHWNDATAPATPEAATWDGWKAALKPSWEPIIVAMKPLDGTFAQNALTHGVAGLWIEGGRVGLGDEKPPAGSGNGSTKSLLSQVATSNGNGGNRTPPSGRFPSGRFPANLVLDPEAAAMLDAQSGERASGGSQHERSTTRKAVYSNWGRNGDRNITRPPDTGGASRFFYTAKSSPSERQLGMPEGEENRHPTLKPVDLLRYLARLTKTPTGGVILDPFAGSGSCGIAAAAEGRDYIGIERDERHAQVARWRVGWAYLEPSWDDLDTGGGEEAAPRQLTLFEGAA